MLFIEFENENKDHIVKMNNILQCLFNNEISDNLKVNFIIYTMKKIFLKIRRMRILGACIFSKFFGGKITAFSTDVTYRITIIIFKKTSACVFWAPVFFCKFFGGKLGLRTRKSWQRKMNEFTNFTKMSVLTVCPNWKREICLDKQLLDWTLK